MGQLAALSCFARLTLSVGRCKVEYMLRLLRGEVCSRHLAQEKLLSVLIFVCQSSVCIMRWRRCGTKFDRTALILSL